MIAYVNDVFVGEIFLYSLNVCNTYAEFTFNIIKKKKITEEKKLSWAFKFPSTVKKDWEEAGVPQRISPNTWNQYAYSIQKRPNFLVDNYAFNHGIAKQTHAAKIV